MSNELLKALKTAYEAEKEGLRTYLKFAKQTKVLSGKNMFIQLALDEVDHMELIEKFTNQIMEGKPLEVIDVPSGRLSKFMPDASDASLQKVDKAELGDEEALKIALEHEKKAHEFYKEEASKATSPEVKEFFEKLAEVEEKHYNIIQAELDTIRNDGFWFDTMEFSVEM
ncbi:rubrerythrin domain protein [Deferribacter desulfuricans SSM1]|uniref:Rubrerythrin domain protein n=1 Tax=Deferribacter desulfuricans (strain DSM 14783 / JCM 11476 / NBRC 101012 / SSM1) TaxID=639282 RepID=D3PB70_DEFDS|nr:ferritin family protein [Deferribacter desulfuricans]BAI79843.1 rubrerythrin domain protein [Deferribacter desulfuricans SSM1]